LGRVFHRHTACLLGELAGDVCLHLVTARTELRIDSATERDTTYAYSFAEDNSGSGFALRQFREQLRKAVEDGSASLEALARHFLVSNRTLQRRLAEHGTTWRTELDTVRRRLFTDVAGTGIPATLDMAQRLGFTDERSLRRARRRWENLSAAQARPVPAASGAGQAAGSPGLSGAVPQMT